MSVNFPTRQLAWVSAVAPAGDPYQDRLSEHSDVKAWHVSVEFEPWKFASEDPKLTRKDTYGWKPQLQAAHPGLVRSVGEVELVQRLRSAGYEAYWIDNFGGAPSIWWSWTSRANRLPSWLLDLDRRIRKHDLMRPYKTGGWPDVVAWNSSGNEVRFVEYKGPSTKNPNKEDSIKPSQDAWLRAALDLEVIPGASYVVAKWKPSLSAASLLARQIGWRSE